MLITEWGWEEQRFVEVDCPDELVKDFMDYMHRDKHWRENPDLVERRWKKFIRDWTNVRNERALQAAAGVCTAVTKSGRPCKVKISIEDGLCAIHRRALAAV